MSDDDRYSMREEAESLRALETAQSDTKDARIRELEAALRDLYEFHVSHDTREGHAKRCNRWQGYGCTCGGTRVVDGAKLALAGSPSRPDNQLPPYQDREAEHE